jgi:hypothetical protein
MAGKKKKRKIATPVHSSKPDSHSIAASIPEYYHVPFQAIGSSRHAEIDHAYLSAPVDLRSHYFESQGALGKGFVGAEAHTLLRGLADCLEEVIAEKIKQHSVFFWMHLYRRIGVGLHLGVESKRDANTIALVRLIVEASIQKYGRLDEISDVGLSGKIGWDQVLGGLFQQTWTEMLGSHGYDNYIRLLTEGQWVLVKFGASDLVTIYAIEGLAYQYWRCTAALRAVSKGSQLIVGSQGQMQHVESRSLGDLIDSYDRRIQRPSILYSNAGLIARVSDTEKQPLHFIVNCEYNVHRTPLKDIYTDNGPLSGDFKPNFVIQPLDAKSFLGGHAILSEPFLKKTGMRLDHVIVLLVAVGVMALSKLASYGLPNWLVVHELTKRAYRVLSYTSEALREELQVLAQECCEVLGVSSDDIEASTATFVDRFTLDVDSQKAISLWTYGPRAIFAPYGAAIVMDISAASRILVNLFFGVRDTFGKKGFEFEKAATAFLASRGFNVLRDRELRLESGEKRETDIAIRIHDTLVLCDCRSIERPLDIEIGAPGRLEKRQEFLAAKLEAVTSLGNFIRHHPKGANFDFSWAKVIHSVGVTPFIEWIWSDADAWWVDKHADLPRIMAISELDDWLQRLNTS